MLTTTGVQNLWADLTQNTATTNKSRGLQLYNQYVRYYATKYWFVETSYNYPGGTVASQSTYQEPYDMKDVVDFYIVSGSLRYVVTEAPNATFWDQLQFAQYSSDIPQYYWRFNGVTNVFPTPASSGNQLTWRYRRRLIDLNLADYTTGTVSVTNASTTVTGSGTSWFRGMAGCWLQIAANNTSATTNGDNGWYQIASVASTGSLTLVNQYQGSTVAGGSYTIGQASIIPEDYQDVPLYAALKVYYNSIVPDKAQYQLYEMLVDQQEAKLDAEYGNKSTNVRITAADAELTNPNLYVRSLG